MSLNVRYNLSYNVNCGNEEKSIPQFPFDKAIHGL